MKNFYFVIVEEIDGKKIAYAEHIANEWNNDFKRNGEYLFV